MLLGAVACDDGDEQASDATDPVGSTDASTDSDTDEADAEADAELDGAPEDFDADADATEPPDPNPGGSTTGMSCESADECDDGVYCNGVERCVEDADTRDKTCQPALRPHCPEEHLPCDEVMRSCNCQTPDKDNDGDDAKVCGGQDCDDTDILCHYKAREICDDDDRDEDCDPTTVGDRDSDKDGVVDRKCRNRDPDTGEWHQGPDCDDTRSDCRPEGIEVCDYVDNNCNGFIDEKRGDDGTYEEVNGGQMNGFVPDWDGDEQGATGVEETRYCIYDAPRRFVLATNPQDCDDQNAKVRIGAPEFCDNVDNDCDGLVDADDSDLIKEYDFTGTTVRCVDGAWIIPPGGCPEDRLWCPDRGDPIEQGCRTESTKLSSCRGCRNECQFSCGVSGCDEVVKFAAGGDQTCGVTREGRVACWGRGAEGRLGNDSTVQSPNPVWVIGLPEDKPALDVSVGFAHACAIVGQEREVWCWGSNSSGQLAQFMAETSIPFIAAAVPVRVDAGATSLTQVAQISAGRTHTCAVQTMGRLLCFGSGARGRLANGVTSAGPFLAVAARRAIFDPEDEVYVYQELTDVTQVSVGEDHGCALLRDGRVGCWGDNSFGQLGNGGTTADPMPGLQLVPGLAGVQMIAAGGFHTCALVDDRVFCWGRGKESQLGRAPGQDEAAVRPVAGLTGVSSIAAGREFACALIDTGHVACWGLNSRNQLGGKEMTASATPLQVPLERIVSLAQSGGWSHMCAQRASGPVCWGSNTYGQLGVPGATALQFEQISAAAGEQR